MKRVLGVGGPLTAALIAVLVVSSVSAADPFCAKPASNGCASQWSVAKPPFYAHVGRGPSTPDAPFTSNAHARWSTSPKNGYIQWVLEWQRKIGAKAPWYTEDTAPASSTRKFGKTGSRQTFHVPVRSWPLQGQYGFMRYKATFTFKRATAGPDPVVKRLVAYSFQFFVVPPTPGVPPGGPG
jgi:hypothetical protein